MARLRPSSRTTWCEWKGRAGYYDLVVDEEKVLPNVAWYYPDPTPGFAKIKDYVAFYPNSGEAYECFVDGEQVQPQPGSFYGGWVTKDIQGIVKGGRQIPFVPSLVHNATWAWLTCAVDRAGHRGLVRVSPRTTGQRRWMKAGGPGEARLFTVFV
jgi:hypothetical protein